MLIFIAISVSAVYGGAVALVEGRVDAPEHRRPYAGAMPMDTTHFLEEMRRMNEERMAAAERIADVLARREEAHAAAAEADLLLVAAEEPYPCPECGADVDPPGAEALAFNSEGACPACEGTGIVREVDDDVDDGVLVVSVGAGGTSTGGSAPASAHDEVPPAKTRAAARVAASRRFIGPTPPGRG